MIAIYRSVVVCLLLPLLSWPLAAAADDDDRRGHIAHGSELYGSFQITNAVGRTDNRQDFSDSDYEGWYGNDRHKFYFQGELQRYGNETERSEYWFLYSRFISEFWDLQAGTRYDSQPYPRGHLVVGFNGDAPFFVETEIYAVFGNHGAVNIRLHQNREFLISQKLVIKPHLELNLNNKDIRNPEIPSGLGETEIGLMLRYDMTRHFAPYLDIRYQYDPPYDDDDDEDYSFMRFMAGIKLSF